MTEMVTEPSWSRLIPRMLDCEFVNRFLAFYLLGVDRYTGNLEEYLNDVMIQLQKESTDTIDKCRKDFLKAMNYAHEIFGDFSFRKINADGKYGRINKPLYDAVSVNLAKLSTMDCERLLKKKEVLLRKYEALLKDKAFVDDITNGTAKIQNVQNRYAKISEVFQEVLADD